MSRSPIARQLLRGQNSCFGQTILINSLLDWICITMFWNRDIQHLLRQRRKEHSNSSKFGPFTSSLHYERNPREYVPTMDPFLQTVAKQRVTNSFKSTKGMHSIIHLKGGGWLKQFGSLVSLCTRVTRVLLNHALIGDLRKRFIPNSNHSYPNGFRDLKQEFISWTIVIISLMTLKIARSFVEFLCKNPVAFAWIRNIP